uniref:GDP-mannose 4,6 dehydratase n=1 Tax=Marseillevirus LCMAC103 TaxID=2506604 RepID=A0A481YV63_9VIRU|nr:MAG: GDP-mannose 4,6 dehydratase [Marseillevirus LCMAC103]
MEFKASNVLVTGGCGFIGGHFIDFYARAHPDVDIVNVDAMYHAAREANVSDAVRASGRYKLVKGNTANLDLMKFVLAEYRIDTVVHFAAQSHVDDSFEKSLRYTQDNVMGTHNLLEACRQHGRIKKFVHVSTDEVYGESLLGAGEHRRTEASVLNPTNPYAASKAAAEMYANSYRHSFGLPVVIVRMNNVFGPRQHTEKLIPRFIALLAGGDKLTIQGSGLQVRSFVHVADVARAFDLIVARGAVGEIYNIGSDDEHSVLEIAQKLVDIQFGSGEDLSSWVTHVADRPFNDTRYYISSRKLEKLGWKREVDMDSALAELIVDA